MKNKKVLIIGAFVLFGFAALIGVTRAWTAPSAAPPGGSPVITYSGGNVGIGTGSPSAKLEVRSTALSVTPLRIESTAADSTATLIIAEPGPWITLQDTQVGGHIYYLRTGAGVGAGNFEIYDNTATATRIAISGTGNVGIGTSSPGAKLEVAGQVKITGGAPGAGKVLTSDATGLATWQTMTAQAFPVGSVFLSVVSTNPSTLLGYGTWVQIAQGRALVGQDPGDADWDVPEETRGAKTHTLTVNEMPSHNHPQDAHSHTPYINSEENGGYTRIDGSGPGGTLVPNGSMTPSTPYIHPAGSGWAHNNIQPSFVIYVWKRTL